MENLKIEKSALTPQIHFHANGDLILKGISTPENVQSFFQPAFDWLNLFKETHPEKVNFVLEVDYLNTSSSKTIVQLMVLVNSMKQHGTQVHLTWRYEDGDDDILELGQDLQLSARCELEFVPIKKS